MQIVRHEKNWRKNSVFKKSYKPYESNHDISLVFLKY